MDEKIDIALRKEDKQMKADTQMITINVEAEKLFEFVSNPENLAKWEVDICNGIRKIGEDWLVETAIGDLKLKVVSDANTGVVDYHLTPPLPIRVSLFTRVLKNGLASEFIVTHFQLPLIPNFEKQKDKVRIGLEKLKEIMEGSGLGVLENDL
ncbi:MAG: SRPBCC family protein [Planctomycetota bacterium]